MTLYHKWQAAIKHAHIIAAHDFSFRHLQASTDTKTSELRNEVKLKAFEAERLQIVYEESVRTLKECQLENEKLQKKLQVRAAPAGLTSCAKITKLSFSKTKPTASATNKVMYMYSKSKTTDVYNLSKGLITGWLR